MSRKIEDLQPELQRIYHLFADKMEAAGIDFIVTCTARTQAEQDALYAQGRTLPGRKVTWTRRSRHTGGRAFDIVIMENGKPDWDVSNRKWEEAGLIGQSVGLEWGGGWLTSKDFPHFELKDATA